jgi:hypothetical protein
VSWEAIDRAIELNGTAISMSRAAFLWGRRAAQDTAAVLAHARPEAAVSPAPTLEQLLARREGFLAEYQDAAYASRYRKQVERVRAAEAALGSSQLTAAVAHNLFKLMAIKDEYEVARLYAESDFMQKLDERFEGDFTLRFHFAPPLLVPPDPNTGKPRKLAFGPWMFTALKWLAKGGGCAARAGMCSAAARNEGSNVRCWRTMKPTSRLLGKLERACSTTPWRWPHCRRRFAASAMSGDAASMQARGLAREARHRERRPGRPTRSRRKNAAIAAQIRTSSTASIGQ